MICLKYGFIRLVDIIIIFVYLYVILFGILKCCILFNNFNNIYKNYLNIEGIYMDFLIVLLLYKLLEFFCFYSLSMKCFLGGLNFKDLVFVLLFYLGRF